MQCFLKLIGPAVFFPQTFFNAFPISLGNALGLFQLPQFRFGFSIEVLGIPVVVISHICCLLC